MKKIITTIAIMCASLASFAQLTSITLSGMDLVCSETSDTQTLSLIGDDDVTNKDDLFDWVVTPNTGRVQFSGDNKENVLFQAGDNDTYSITATSKTVSSITSTITLNVTNFVALTGVTILGMNTVLSGFNSSIIMQVQPVPANATNPKISFSDRRLTKSEVTTLPDFRIQAKNNGISSITVTASNFGGSVASVPLVVTVSGIGSYRETFLGTKSDGYANPSTYNARTGNIGSFTNMPNNLWWAWGAKYSLTTATGTTDGIFVTPTAGINSYPASPPRFFLGPDKLHVFLNGFDININGSGILANQNPVIIEVENLSAPAMEMQITIHDEDDVAAGDFAGGVDNKYGTPTLITIPGMTKQFVSIPTPMEREFIDAVGFRTRNFEGNFVIRSINIGYNTPTMLDLSKSGTTKGNDVFTVSGVFQPNVINELTWTVTNPSSEPSALEMLFSSVVGVEFFRVNSLLEDRPCDNGVSTIVGKMFASTVTSTILVTFGGICIPITSATISGASTLKVNGVATYSVAGISPSNAEAPISTIWMSSNPSIAAINATTGVLTALGVGTTNIQAKHILFNNTTITSNSIAVSVTSLNTSVESSLSAATFVVAPNPTKDVLLVSAPILVSGLKVYSLTGVEVASSSTDSVSLAGAADGVYILEISTPSGNVFKKVVKE